MSLNSGRRLLSTVVVTTALAGALASGGGTAAADVAEPVGSSGSLETLDRVVLTPMADVGSSAVGSVCSAVRNLILGQNWCLSRPGMGWYE